jgi:hypothetical protein
LRLGLPEYRLRQLINQGMGYRNFAAFLNFYRIADTKTALADPVLLKEVKQARRRNQTGYFKST